VTSLNPPRRAPAAPTRPVCRCDCGCLTRPRRYPSDVTDAQWVLLEPLLPPPAATRRRGGRPETHHRRAVLDALFYWVTNGITWRAMPADYPPWATVYDVYLRWGRRGGTQNLLDALRETDRVNNHRAPAPTAAIIDSQTVAEAADATVAAATSGYNGHKRINGRKRHLLVDTLGLILHVVITPANTPDSVAAYTLIDHAAALGIQHIWADTGYRAGELHRYAAAANITLDIVKRPPAAATPGFLLLPRRWVIERTNAWISRHRRCARDYERTPASHLYAVHWAAIRGISRRITGLTTRWRQKPT
jgi:transposase